jgi:hypothetical protein
MATDSGSRKAFEIAQKRAFWQAIAAAAQGRPNQLLAWKDARGELHPRGQESQEHQTVALDQIIGSVGRYRDFDRAFLPQKKHLKERWASIARASDAGTNMPPIRLYQVGEAYFCVDGHHRISVAQSRGARFIDAWVTEVHCRVPITADMDARTLEIKGEYTRFLEHTRLDRLRPDQEVVLTACGGYQKLLEHITIHRHLMERAQHGPVSADKAVCDWYDVVYAHLVHIIRELDLLARLPDRTEADLYLWITDHQRDLQARCGPTVSPERAAEHLSKHHTSRLVKRLANTIQEWITGIDCARLASDEPAP